MASWQAIARRIRVPLGFACTLLYILLARPVVMSLMWGAALIIPGLLIRALASGHLQKNEALAMTGPYAYTRNPLYLGSLIMAAGFALAARSWWIAGVLVAMFVAIYLPVIRAEEVFLAAHFPDFTDYAGRVPRLMPSLRPVTNTPWSFSWDLYWKHREYNATVGAAAIFVILIVKLLWRHI